MSDAIPKGWFVDTIANVSSKVGSGITPKGGSKVYSSSGVKFIRSQNVHFSGLSLNDLVYISQDIHSSMSGSKLKDGDVLLNITGASIGRCTFVPEDFGEANVNQHVCIIRPKEKVSTQFLAQWLASDFGQHAIAIYQAGGNREGLNFQQIRSISLNRPPLPEQKKIAAILSSVDEMIEKTRAQIDKLKDLKTGMMQELLTKGIGHTEFKDSPVGRMPMVWKVSPLISICNRITDGTHQAVKTSDYGKIPFLYVSCIRNGKILWSKASALTESGYEIASKGRVACPGDILYTAVGSYGHAALVETDKRFSFQRHIAFIQPDKSVVDPYFLVSVLNSTTGRSQADTLAIGNAQLTVTLGDLGTFMIPIPPIHEQKKISKLIKSIVNNIREHEAKLEASLHIKKALMQDLLTGKIRVNVEARELAEA